MRTLWNVERAALRSYQSSVSDLGSPAARLQLDDKRPGGGRRHEFPGRDEPSRTTTRSPFSLPRQSRSREDGRAFHPRRRVFDLRCWAFVPRSRSVVGGRADRRWLSLRRAEVDRVMAFGETTHDPNSSLLHSMTNERMNRVPQKRPNRLQRGVAFRTPGIGGVENGACLSYSHPL